ncbi:MAG: hypothetical protein ACO1RX_03930 [Candidatus Sericytochromatia bacterium]
MGTARGAVLRRLLEWPWLVLLNLTNHFWNLGLWLREIRRYYGHVLLCRADLLWMLEYGLQSPFALSQRAQREADLPPDLLIYGETPWPTLEQICDALMLQSDELFIDLGAGTGRNLLFVNYWYGARSRGYELVPRFVTKFRWLQQRLELTGRVEMRQANWLNCPLAELSEGQAFLLVGSCYDDVHLAKATQRLAQLPEGVRLATVSYPLDDPAFEPLAEFRAPFSWGWGTVYIQRRRGDGVIL